MKGKKGTTFLDNVFYNESRNFKEIPLINLIIFVYIQMRQILFIN